MVLVFPQFVDDCDERAVLVRGEAMDGSKAGRNWKKEKDKAKHWHRLGPRLGPSRLVGSDSLGKCCRCLPARSEIESARSTRSTNSQSKVQVFMDNKFSFFARKQGSFCGLISCTVVEHFSNFIRGYLCRKSLSKSTTVSSLAQLLRRVNVLPDTVRSAHWIPLSRFRHSVSLSN